MFRLTLLTLGLLLSAYAPASSAQPTTVMLNPHGGYSVSEQAPFAGADFRVADASLPFVYHLAFDYYIEPQDAERDAPTYQFDVDSYIPFFTYDPNWTPYLGGGFSMQRTEPPDEDPNIDWGLNGTAGIVLNPTGTVQPFAQARVTLAQETTVDVMGGLLIVLYR